eukprot:1779-Heterococcus_DN1.PRE.1
MKVWSDMNSMFTVYILDYYMIPFSKQLNGGVWSSVLNTAYNRHTSISVVTIPAIESRLAPPALGINRVETHPICLCDITRLQRHSYSVRMYSNIVVVDASTS